MLSPVIGYLAPPITSQLSREPASHLETLFNAQVASHFDLAAVRTQSEMCSFALANNLSPVTIQLEMRDLATVANFDCYVVASNRDALVIARMAVDITKRNIQHDHLDSGKRHYRPRSESEGKRGSDAERDSQNENKD
jgi:hypothetical protein